MHARRRTAATLGCLGTCVLLAFGFEQLALTMVWLVVRTDNERAVALFRRHGFVVIDRYVGATIVDNQSRDKYRMELRCEEWRGHRHGDTA